MFKFIDALYSIPYDQHTNFGKFLYCFVAVLGVWIFPIVGMCLIQWLRG